METQQTICLDRNKVNLSDGKSFMIHDASSVERNVEHQIEVAEGSNMGTIRTVERDLNLKIVDQ